MPTGPENPSAARISPEIEFSYGEIESTMMWGNTLIRRFYEGEGAFDHVCHKLEDGRYIAFQPSPALLEQLITDRFPSRLDPIVDEATIQWYAQVMSNELGI